MSIKIRIQERLNRSRRYVFMRADFGDIAGYDQVGRVLRELVKDGELIKVGYGVYTKSRKNPITGRLMPALAVLMQSFLKPLGALVSIIHLAEAQ